MCKFTRGRICVYTYTQYTCIYIHTNECNSNISVCMPSFFVRYIPIHQRTFTIIYHYPIDIYIYIYHYLTRICYHFMASIICRYHYSIDYIPVIFNFIFQYIPMINASIPYIYILYQLYEFFLPLSNILYTYILCIMPC